VRRFNKQTSAFPNKPMNFIDHPLIFPGPHGLVVSTTQTLLVSKCLIVVAAASLSAEYQGAAGLGKNY
jgi:hypothetical protein